MINELDEMTDKVSEGRDTGVIEKQLQPKVGTGTLIFEIILWFLPIPIIFGLIYLFKKVKAQEYLEQLQQRIQADASTIDNYLEQRVQILQNLASIVEKSAKLDHDTQTEIAGLRSGAISQGANIDESSRNLVQSSLDRIPFAASSEIKAQARSNFFK